MDEGEGEALSPPGDSSLEVSLDVDVVDTGHKMHLTVGEDCFSFSTNLQLSQAQLSTPSPAPSFPSPDAATVDDERYDKCQIVEPAIVGKSQRVVALRASFQSMKQDHQGFFAQ